MFEFTEEQNLIRKSVNEFARKELALKASYWDEHEEFPWDIVRKMAEIGLTGMRLPASYGGGEVDLITLGVALEEVARFDHSCGIILCGCNITGRVLLNASKGIRDSYLPDIVKGRSILAFGAAEPDAGSDIRAIKCMAKRQGNRFLVSGEKSMITFAQVAQGFAVLVRMEGAGRGDLSCVFVEANRQGIDIQSLKGFGWRATKWGNIAFNEVSVPAENLIGEESKALSMLESTVEEQRALTGIIALGTARQALDEAITYAKNRNVFGKPLGKFEGVQFRLAEDFTALEAARLLCYRSLFLTEKNAPEASVWAAMANLIGGETAYQVVNHAMDVYGGLGYSKELPFERYLRDVKATQIANATLKMDIGRGLFGKEFSPYA